jgi:hypothetical protein
MTHEQKREAIVRAYIVHDPEDGDYLSWSHTADMGHGHTPLYKLETLPREPGESELREALEPFALAANRYDKCKDKRPLAFAHEFHLETLSIVDLRRARSALSRPAQDAEGWMPIETAPKDGTAFIGSDGKYAYRTRLIQHYEKFPHEEGGPTFRGLWNKEDEYSVCPWSPKMWRPLPSAPRTDGGE